MKTKAGEHLKISNFNTDSPRDWSRLQEMTSENKKMNTSFRSDGIKANFKINNASSKDFKPFRKNIKSKLQNQIDKNLPSITDKNHFMKPKRTHYSLSKNMISKNIANVDKMDVRQLFDNNVKNPEYLTKEVERVSFYYRKYIFHLID